MIGRIYKYIKDIFTVREIVVWDSKQPSFRSRVIVRRNKIDDFTRYRDYQCDEKSKPFNPGSRYDIDRTGLK